MEVDGPHHFTANTLVPLGEMFNRDKLLASRGWTVVSVPFYAWSGKAEEYKAEILAKVCFPGMYFQAPPHPGILLNKYVV